MAELWLERIRAARAADPGIDAVSWPEDEDEGGEGWDPADGDGAGDARTAPSEAEPAPVVAAGDGAVCHPARVTRRVKWQRGGVGLDWVQGTGDACWMETVRGHLSEWFGEPTEGKGGMFYRSSFRFAGGVSIYYGSARGVRETYCVVIPGGALSPMEADDRLDLLRVLLAIGMRCSRIDVAQDFFCDDGVGLVDAVASACAAGCVRGVKRHEPRRPMAGPRVLGNSVYLGRRGKYGSGRLTRVYDKGLETKTRPMGHWERWETEFNGKIAAALGETLAASGDWALGALSAALGAADFRELGGRGDRHVERRRQLGWWRDLNDRLLGEGVDGVRLKAPPMETKLESVESWLKRSVVPSVRVMARIKGCNVVDAFADMCREMPEFNEDWLFRSWAWQLYQREQRRLRVQSAASRAAGVPF